MRKTESAPCPAARRGIIAGLCSAPHSRCAFIVLILFACIALTSEIYTVICEHRGIVPVFNRTDETACYQPPSPRHWMGTDYQGRDVLLRALAGSATAVKVGAAASLIAAAIGTLLGAAAGYYGGRADDITVWLYSVFSSMPGLLFILAFALLISRGFLSHGMMKIISAAAAALHTEPGALAIYFAIGATGWVTLCRVVRAETMALRTRPFIAAAKVAGTGNFKIVLRHILPNVGHLVIIYFTLNFAGAVMTEVIVSYLGFGVQAAPSWGVMISDGQERLWQGIWWEITAAGGMMFLLVLALNITGDRLRDVLDPRNQER